MPPRVRDLLYRFRPAGTPGAAAATGVPVDQDASANAELEPLLARLSDSEDACDRLLEEARRDAQEILTRGQDEGRAVKGGAARRAEAERAAAAAQFDRAAEEDTRRLAGEGAADIAAMRERAAAAMPATVDAVVEKVAALIGSPGVLPAGRTRR